MGQVTIYLDRETEQRMKRAAKSNRMSVSKWVASAIQEKMDSQWPPEIQRLAGAWRDFPSLDEIRAGAGTDIAREPF